MEPPSHGSALRAAHRALEGEAPLPPEAAVKDSVTRLLATGFAPEDERGRDVHAVAKAVFGIALGFATLWWRSLISAGRARVSW